MQIGGPLNVKLMEQQFDEVMRLAASIKQGTVTASLILRKLAAYPRQNSLATGLREYGRLERTLFTLKWLRDPALRRRLTGGLNKGEARNALARTMFFHRPGEIWDRSYENQRYRASGLNLVIAAITLWNTVYLERAVNALRERVPSTTRCSDTSLRSAGITSGWLGITTGTPTKGSPKADFGPCGEFSQWNQRSPRFNVRNGPFLEVTPCSN